MTLYSEYRQQLQSGQIQRAYRGILGFMKRLQNDLRERHPDFVVPANFYQGQMDISFFTFTSQALVDRKLKMPLVFRHEEFRFDAWLCGNNKKVHQQWLKLFYEHGWDGHPLSPADTNADYVTKTPLAGFPDFEHPNELSRQIEMSALRFIADVEGFLDQNGL